MNEYKLLPGEFALIKLTKGQWTLVDVSQLSKLLTHRWCTHGRRRLYAVTNIGRGRLMAMHRFLLPHDELHTDHINGDSLDNRLCNLRPATASQNILNQRGVVGVRQRGNKWEAHIQLHRRQHSKSFDSREEAIAWRQELIAQQFATPPKSEQH